MSILEAILLDDVVALSQRGRRPVKTSVLADLHCLHPRQALDVLYRLEERGAVKRPSPRGGWLPARKGTSSQQGEQGNVSEYCPPMGLSRTPRRVGMTRREEIFQYICRVAKENRGVTPSVRSIAASFALGKTTVLTHVTKLVAEDRLAWVDGRLMVVDSEWTEPPYVDI